MSKDESMQEVLTAINNFATQVNQKFEQIDKRFGKIDKRFDKIDKRFDDVYLVLDNLQTSMIKMHDDHVAAIEWLKRHERRHDKHDADIGKLNAAVGV